MKKGSKFLIGLVTASITFGALMLTLGKSEFNKYGHRSHHGCYQHCEHTNEQQHIH